MPSSSSISLLCPMNLSFWWNLGSLILFCVVIQMVLGISLSFYYSSGDFYSTLFTQLEVFSGDVLQLTYANLPGIIFLLLYLQTLKGIIFNSSYSMKVFLVSGFSLLILMVCISFMGEGISSYLSFWKASLFSFPMTLLSLKLYGMLIATVPCMAAQLPLFSLKVFCCYDFLLPLLFLVITILYVMQLRISLLILEVRNFFTISFKILCQDPEIFKISVFCITLFMRCLVKAWTETECCQLACCFSGLFRLLTGSSSDTSLYLCTNCGSLVPTHHCSDPVPLHLGQVMLRAEENIYSSHILPHSPPIFSARASENEYIAIDFSHVTSSV